VEDDLVVAAEFDNRTQAELTVKLLESFGVRSTIQADDMGGFNPSLSLVHGVKVLVRSGDAERARQILAPEA
jgi:hypothetical protein